MKWIWGKNDVVSRFNNADSGELQFNLNRQADIGKVTRNDLKWAFCAQFGL